MTVLELYDALCQAFPEALSEAWDHDGLQCCPDPKAPVRRVLCSLDVTERVVAHAIREGYDVILSHHPMLFHAIHEVTPTTPEGRKLTALLRAGISVMSFHTRADAAAGGVNDLLCEALGLTDIAPLADGLGRVGTLPSPLPLAALGEQIKKALNAPLLSVGDAGREASRVAVLGGSGKDLLAAAAAVADTYLTGRLSYETVNAAPELGINLIEAGHYYTEDLFPRAMARRLPAAFPGLEACYLSSLEAKIL